MKTSFLKTNLALFLTAFSLQALAISENNYQTVYDLVATGDGTFYQNFAFVGVNNVDIVYTKFGDKKGAKGSMVISTGRTESSLKYIETAYDFIHNGFSPVYVINHRGQGFSGRLLPDPDKGHVEDYKDYADDFAQFMTLVLQDKQVDKKNLVLVTHSMGGSIGVDYLLANNSPFKAVAMSAPLFHILNEKSEMDLLHDTGLACFVLFQCNDYIPGGGPFNWKNRIFANNDLTHSQTRFTFRDHLWKQWPDLQLGDPTIRWVRETIQSNVRRRDIQKLRKLNTPFLIIQAQNDTVVDNRGPNEICSRMKSGLCKIEVALKARHELLMEKDSIRDSVVKHMTDFFNKH
jgi:lysophospholipase